MNRNVKNIIMIAIAVILAVSMVFTINAASKDSPMPADKPEQQLQQPPGNEENSDQQPSGSPGSEQNERQGSQPPAMPGASDSEPDNKNGNRSDEQQLQQPPGSEGNSDQQPPDIPGSAQMSSKDMAPDRIDGKYYAMFGAEALAFSLIIIYLMLSGMNRLSFSRTFRSRSRILIFILATVLAAGCLTQAEAGVSRYLKHEVRASDQLQVSQGDGSEQSESIEASAAKTVDGSKETLNDTYTSSNANESTVLVTGGGTLTSTGASFNKKSGDSSNTGASDFSGVNSAILVNDGSNAKISNATIKSSAKGGNAVFATGEKSIIEISDSMITTTGESSSRGLDATYGGTIRGSDLKIRTQGGSSAAMATDRGEGTVSVSDSDLETNGAGSPLIYSTGDISLAGSTGAANGAQIAVVEGKNSASITNSDLSCSAAGNRGDVDIAGVMVYQSMSGDAGEGTGSFSATDSKLSISKESGYYKTAPMFFVTNTDAVINLCETELDFGSGTLLSAKGTDEWGDPGSNGGSVTLKAADQKLEGDIQLDKISSLSMSLTDGSAYTGTINEDNAAESVSISLSEDSSIKLTGNSYVSSLKNADSSNSNIDFNGYKLYVNGKSIN